MPLDAFYTGPFAYLPRWSYPSSIVDKFYTGPLSYIPRIFIVPRTMPDDFTGPYLIRSPLAITVNRMQDDYAGPLDISMSGETYIPPNPPPSGGSIFGSLTMGTHGNLLRSHMLLSR